MTTPPTNFSWVSDTVAGFGFPHEKCNLDYIVNVAKISNMITLCEEAPDVKDFPSLKWHHLPICDMSKPNLDVIKKAMKIIEDAEKRKELIGVHCQLGLGRAGTILACYIVQKYGLSSTEAIESLREKRKGSVVNRDQELAVEEFSRIY